LFLLPFVPDTGYASIKERSMFTCTIVVDDHPSAMQSLVPVHGLSFYLSDGEHSLLFDVGPDGTLLRNAALLRLPLQSLSSVVLSHGHYDHAGGFPSLVSSYSCPLLVTGKGFFEDKYLRHGEAVTYMGCCFSKGLLNEKQIPLHEVAGRELLLPNLWVVGGFPRRYKDETISPRFAKGDLPYLVDDPFNDEIALVAEGEKDVSMLVACAHPGILSMVSHVEGLFGKPVREIAGGLHLHDATEERMRKTVEGLSSLHVETLLLCHCSGDSFFAMAKSSGAFHGEQVGVGDVLLL
jgi:7,8-dihydropterin-6-yl-methyl-4-(beta-D-ribofuranosyl)aminobenzene 5'-phosphate synthase